MTPGQKTPCRLLACPGTPFEHTGLKQLDQFAGVCGVRNEGKSNDPHGRSRARNPRRPRVIDRLHLSRPGYRGVSSAAAAVSLVPAQTVVRSIGGAPPRPDLDPRARQPIPRCGPAGQCHLSHTSPSLSTQPGAHGSASSTTQRDCSLHVVIGSRDAHEADAIRALLAASLPRAAPTPTSNHIARLFPVDPNAISECSRICLSRWISPPVALLSTRSALFIKW